MSIFNSLILYKLYFFVSVICVGLSNVVEQQQQRQLTCATDMSKSVFEIVLLQDNTIRTSTAIAQIKERFASLFSSIGQQSPGSRFGYAVYNDWPQRHPARKQNEVVETFVPLYTLSPYSTSITMKIQESFKTTPVRKSAQSSLLATALAALDRNSFFQWSTGVSPIEGKTTYKVIILSTEAKSLKQGDDHWYSGREFTNINDVDATSQSPSFQKIGEILNARHIAFLVVNNYDESKPLWYGTPIEFWNAALAQMGIFSSHQVLTYGLNADQFAAAVIDKLKQLTCAPAVKPVLPNPVRQII